MLGYALRIRGEDHLVDRRCTLPRRRPLRPRPWFRRARVCPRSRSCRRWRRSRRCPWFRRWHGFPRCRRFRRWRSTPPVPTVPPVASVPPVPAAAGQWHSNPPAPGPIPPGLADHRRCRRPARPGLPDGLDVDVVAFGATAREPSPLEARRRPVPRPDVERSRFLKIARLSLGVGGKIIPPGVNNALCAYGQVFDDRLSLAAGSAPPL